MKILAQIILLLLLGFAASQTNITLTQHTQPDNGKVVVGSEFTVSCRTTADISVSSVMWYRIQDSLRYQIGVDEVLNKEFLTDGTSSNIQQERYRLSGGVMDDNSRTYTLKVSHAKPEDSADIECSLVPGDVAKRINIAVCDSVSSSSCDCMQTHHWASPQCFVEVESDWESVALDATALRRATIALGVILGLVTIYSLIMCVLLGRDSVEELERQKEERAEYSTRRARVTQGSDRSEVELNDAASDVTTSATTSSGISASSANKNHSDVVKRNGNTRISGRRMERANAELKLEVNSWNVNKAFVPDNEIIQSENQPIQQRQLQLPISHDDNIENKATKGKRLIKDQKKTTASVSGHGSNSAINDWPEKGRSGTDLSNSDNRTESYVSNSNSTTSGSNRSNPPTYEQSQINAMHDTMI